MNVKTVKSQPFYSILVPGQYLTHCVTVRKNVESKFFCQEN